MALIVRSRWASRGAEAFLGACTWQGLAPALSPQENPLLEQDLGPVPITPLGLRCSTLMLLFLTPEGNTLRPNFCLGITLHFPQV